MGHEIATTMVYLMFVGIIGFGTLYFFFLAPVIAQNQTQAASASVDYFSWSCSQLESTINQNIEPNYLGLAGNGNAYSIVLLQIMQLKGCAVSP